MPQLYFKAIIRDTAQYSGMNDSYLSYFQIYMFEFTTVLLDMKLKVGHEKVFPKFSI